MFIHLLLRFAHIVFGALWVGTAVFNAFYLLPALRAAGPAGGAIMQHMTARRFPLYMMAVNIITLVSGGFLVYRSAGDLGMAWFEAGQGRVFGAGAVFAIIAAIIGMTVASPTVKRLGEMGTQLQGRGGAPTVEEQATMRGLQDRLYLAVRIVAVFVLLAAAAMSVARYVA